MEAGLPVRHSVPHVGPQNDLAILGHPAEHFPDNVHVRRARREATVIEICLRFVRKSQAYEYTSNLRPTNQDDGPIP